MIKKTAFSGLFFADYFCAIGRIKDIFPVIDQLYLVSVIVGLFFSCSNTVIYDEMLREHEQNL